MSRSPEEGDLAGRELADAIEAALVSAPREPTTFAATAELLVQRRRLTGSAPALAPTVAAAVRADAIRRGAEGSRFRDVGGRLALTAWYLPEELVRSSAELRGLARQHREQTHRAFLRKLESLPAVGFVELMATWLNAEGVSGLRAVRRPGSSSNELHLAGTLSRGHEQVPIAIVVLRGGRDLDAEAVVEVRGALHHYGQASMAWLVALGRARGRARQEVAVGGAAPVVLFDGEALALAMEAKGVGLRAAALPVATIDLDLLDSLRGAPAEPEAEPDEGRGRRRRDRERDDRERDRERDERAPERDEVQDDLQAAERDAPEAAREEEAGEPGEPDAGSEDLEGRGKRRRRRRRRGGRRDEEGAPETAREGAGAPSEETPLEPASAAEAFDDDEAPGSAEEREEREPAEIRADEESELEDRYRAESRERDYDEDDLEDSDLDAELDDLDEDEDLDEGSDEDEDDFTEEDDGERDARYDERAPLDDDSEE